MARWYLSPHLAGSGRQSALFRLGWLVALVCRDRGDIVLACGVGCALEAQERLRNVEARWWCVCRSVSLQGYSRRLHEIVARAGHTRCGHISRDSMLGRNFPPSVLEASILGTRGINFGTLFRSHPPAKHTVRDTTWCRCSIWRIGSCDSAQCNLGLAEGDHVPPMFFVASLPTLSTVSLSKQDSW